MLQRALEEEVADYLGTRNRPRWSVHVTTVYGKAWIVETQQLAPAACLWPLRPGPQPRVNHAPVPTSVHRLEPEPSRIISAAFSTQLVRSNVRKVGQEDRDVRSGSDSIFPTVYL